jgi:hypothetical protein
MSPSVKEKSLKKSSGSSYAELPLSGSEKQTLNQGRIEKKRSIQV